jgi:outer membrane protein OmpA-like peptidoglycan-associated protein
MTSLEQSLVGALSKMGSDFHTALTGAASQEFGNVQGTLEATRQILSDMNAQFLAMQTAFSTIIDKPEQSTSDQVKIGREQTEALTGLMNGLMVRMQESADQNLGNVRAQLTMVVSDLAERVGSLSQDMMAAAGHTDIYPWTGRSAEESQNLNLKLSQDRSMEVVKSALSDLADMEPRRSCFLEKLSATGRGEQEQEATPEESRRVILKIRVKVVEAESMKVAVQ